MGQSSQSLAVLYVEDDPDSVLLFRRAIQRHESVDLLLADSGAAALALARERPTHLAFVDLHLPDTSGVELVGKLRSTPGTAHAMIFLLSAATSDELQAELAGSGADGYLSKPLELARLSGIIEGARARRDSGSGPA